MRTLFQLTLPVLLTSFSFGQTLMSTSIDGPWLFQIDSQKVGVEQRWFDTAMNRTNWKSVAIPEFWESYPGLAAYDGWGWFHATFQIDSLDEPISLHFEGVDDDATVWVNGTEVGGHTGYSDPFAIDISGALQPGNNQLTVLVMDHSGGGGIYKPVSLVPTSRIDEVLKSRFFGTPARVSADWVRDAIIYEVYLRSFSREGTFAGLKEQIQELKKLGVTVLWLMPVHPVGKKLRKGSLGSPYAVQDYYEVNPEFGSMKDFKALLTEVHNQGLKLIIDLVANHTSWDSKLMKEHPEWFTRDARGEVIPPNSDWTDVADLDYSHQGLRDYMWNMMEWWVRDVGIDGFRCDVSELVPTDFWEEARRRLDSIKPVMMLSEGSIPEHHAQAFDLTYSWNIYDVLEGLLKGKRPVSIIDDILKREHFQFPAGSLRMRFHTNHDKNAWDAPAVTKFGVDGMKAAAVLVTTMPGVPMLYNGEEVANDRRLDLFEKVGVDWKKSGSMREFFTRLYSIRVGHASLRRGAMVRVHSQHDRDVYGFFRASADDTALVVINFSGEPRFTSVRIPMGEVFPGKTRLFLKELVRDEHVEVSIATQPQVVLALEPHDFRIFSVLRSE